MNYDQSLKDERRKKYRKAFELALIFSLIFHLGLFHALPGIELSPCKIQMNKIEIKLEDVIETTEVRIPPPPPIPIIPIPSESEAIPADAIIETPVFDLSEVPAPPPPKNRGIYDEFVFVPFEEPPQPVGGLAAIHKIIKYPKKALQRGIEGTVVIGILIDEHGHAKKTQLLKASGFEVGFEEAAIKAVTAIKWIPAKQRDRAVKVWVAVPIRFELQPVI
ncbi:MAG: energy transducer TonB [bacterium]